jgi:hypothetical protein
MGHPRSWRTTIATICPSWQIGQVRRVEHLTRAGEWALGIQHPFGRPGACQMTGKHHRIGERLERAGKVEPPGIKQLLEVLWEATPKEP